MKYHQHRQEPLTQIGNYPMDKKLIKLSTLSQLRELVEDSSEKVGPVMDDYDGGQKAAYEQVLKHIDVFEAIINHTDDRRSLDGR